MNESIPRFEALIEAYHDEIYRYIWRMLNTSNHANTPDEAGDLAQETFVRAYRAYPRLRAGSNVRAWLYRIATNCVYSSFKRDRRRFAMAMPLLDEHDSVLEDGSPTPDMQFLAGETMDGIRDAIAELPDKQRAALLMRYVHELEYPEIADTLNCSEDSARANVYQAIKRLRIRLAEKTNQEVM